ncbi:MAG: hypothetical protein M3Q29_12150 [Chloroflexota bacterium]|nr:hypothetical protein [Chloroflexota bacterium]
MSKDLDYRGGAVGTVATRSGLPGRMVRASRLDPTLYGEVREDASTGAQAAAVVALVALAHGVGGVIRAITLGWSPVEGFVLGPAGELLFWVAASVAIYLVGRYAFRGAATYGQVARPFGFAAAPGVLILLAASASGLGGERLLLPVIFLWRLAAGYVAVRAAFSLSRVKTAVTLLAGVATGLLAVGLGIRLLVALAGWE